MSTIKKQENTETQVDTQCHVCHTSQEDVLLSCANLYCTRKVHARCAVRPESTRLHFCSMKCVIQYLE